MQTIHFHYYFEQTLWNSIRWSFRDWFVWFTLFTVIYHFVGKRIGIYKPNILVIFTITLVAFASGFLQVVIIVSLDFIQGTASRPFWEDFWHFYSKRWFQYIFVFAVFWLLMSLTISRRRQKVNNLDASKIKVDDGKQTHWLELSDIESIEAAGNYVCIHKGAAQIVVRSTIKDMQAKLNSDMFLRVSRSNLVNINAVTSCQRVGRNKLELTLNNGTTINVGSTYKQDIKTILDL